MSFEQITNDLKAMDGKMDTMANQLCEIAPQVARADREVFGNGQPGLAAQIGDVKVTMAGVQATQLLALKVLGAIGVAALGLLGTILFALI